MGEQIILRSNDAPIIDGKVYDFNLSIDEIIDVMKRNSGYHWGIKKHCSGSTFGIIIHKNNEATVIWGDRFLQRVTTDKNTRCLWSKLYDNCGKIDIGILHPEQKLKIMKIEHLKILFKPKNGGDKNGR